MQLRHAIEDACAAARLVAALALPATPGRPLRRRALERWAADIGALLTALRPFLGIVLEGGLSLLLGVAKAW